MDSLKRKYGASLAEVIAFGAEARRKLDSLQQRDQELERINGELRNLESQIRRQAGTLSTQRRELIPALSKAVTRHLHELGFQRSLFSV